MSAPISRISSPRIAGLDAARGLAMVLVFLAHFVDEYPFPAGARDARAVSRVTLAATPTFVLVSGLVIGYLLAGRRGDADRLRRMLVDRGLFLLTAAHGLIFLAHVPLFGVARAWDFVFVTDMIGVCVIVGTLAVPAVVPGVRTLVAAALYGASALLAFAWLPRAGSAAQLVKHLLFGHRPDVEELAFVHGFPILPWLALYLLASVLGQGLAGRRDPAKVARSLAGAGLVLVAAAALVRVLRPVMSRLDLGAGPVHFLTAAGQKLPPGPAYLALYGGFALLVLAGYILACDSGRGVRAMDALQLLGRNSLFAFVLQYAFYYGLMPLLHLPWTPVWPAVFLLTVLLHLAAVAAWQRAGGNRLLTVGYPSLIRAVERWWHSGAGAPASDHTTAAGRV